MTTDNSKYPESGPLSAVTDGSEIFRDFPADIAGICEVVQGLLIHAYWTERYGIVVADQRKYAEMQKRSIPEILSGIESLSLEPLNNRRSPENRLISSCRDFSLLTAAALRSKSIPARIRCGFAKYFGDGFEDHWVCEYWDTAELQWKLADAQLDQLTQKTLAVTFEPSDVPREQFLFAGHAWRLCREGKESPSKFGILQLSGLPFIRANVIRDLLALNQVEVLPWDAGWGLLQGLDCAVSEQQCLVIDELAEISENSNVILAEQIYSGTGYIALPQNWDWSMPATISELMVPAI